MFCHNKNRLLSSKNDVMNCFSQEHGIGDVLKHFAHTEPTAFAIVSSRYDPFSYFQLARQIDHVAGALREAGFGKSSRIAIAVKDSARAALAIVTLACCATAVPLDQNMMAAEVETRLSLLDVDAVCLLAGESAATRSVAEQYGIAVIELMPHKINELSFSVSVPEFSKNIPAKEDAAVIFQTSGTTARPRFVPCRHSHLLAAARQTQAWFNLNKNDRCLSIAPPYYSHGLTFTILAPLLSGGSIAFPSSPSSIDLSEWFEILNPTWYSASPTMHLAISEKLASRASGMKHRLRFAGSGGAKLPENVPPIFQAILGFSILEHYGMTEASQISSNLPSPGLYKAGTVGIPPADTVIVVGNDGNVLPSGQKGEIWVRGPNVIHGYLNEPELNETAFCKGWFRTGDIGNFDGDGFLIIQDRIKELINRGGEKISPFELEKIIMQYPDILDAAAFAVPHPRLGEDVAAALVLRPGTILEPEKLRRFMSTKISWNKIPRRFHIAESIPKGLGGKVLRRKLREFYS